MGFLVAFCLILFIFLYRKRKNLKREGITYLYRTKIGLKIIDRVSKKYPRFLNFLSYIIIAFGYFAMTAMIYLLYITIKIFIINPEVVRIIKIPPLAPLIPYLPQLFKTDILPMFYFTYWIIVIAVVGIVHEFSHGIFARLYKIKVKSTGFAFFGPFVGAFVEPDEKQMQKAKKKNQLAILAAGTFSNAVLCIIFFLVLWLFFASAYSASGVIFNTYAYDFINKGDISYIGGNITINFNEGLNLTEARVNNKTYFIPQEISENLDTLNDSQQIFVYQDSPALRAGLNGIIIEINDIEISKYLKFKQEIEKHKPGDKIILITLNPKDKEKTDYNITLIENPGNKSQGYLGIALIQQQTSIIGKIKSVIVFFKDPNIYYAPKFIPELTEFIYYLLWWLAFINFSVALANMLPAWIFDGGRFFYISILAITKKEKIAKISFKIISYLILGIFLLLMILWAFAFF